MNYACAVWLVKANKWKPKCFAVFKKFMNCYGHPNCLVKEECFKLAWINGHREKVEFT